MITVTGYLRRLGVDAAAPSVAELFRLHAAHVERVPYENLEIWLGRPTTVDPAESWRRIVTGRGGYCFHLNGAFSLLLSRLGYQVTRHYAGVQGHGASPGATGNHLALSVTGLPSDGNPGGAWLVDTGLGDAIHEPLPLVEGDYAQGPFRYRLRASEAEPGGWRFEHDLRGSFVGMDMRPEGCVMEDFLDRHRHLSTSPESSFVKVATVQRRDAAGVDTLTGLVLKRLGPEPVPAVDSPIVLERRQDYFAALADVFGITLDEVSGAERDALWDRLWSAHTRWLGDRAGV
ncbi:arylamine N-acetyltransferase [Microbispora sp. RL4-1S]|uniref:Arylamine N-acetyltransferase n=1 Tax=Microbispora oryzae TaxID=2806554 RepID=A0A941AL36_9ACTN|nr:arylamine N-acetyltransferase [Microbispora oryzae]MBP2705898.1 arylamine N-acetyltransferase [Microbispora oryzae]